MMSLPNKPIEYMSGALPIVTCLGGVLGALIERERCGIRYQEGDSSSLVEALEMLMTNPELADQLGRNSHRLYKERFDADTVYSRMVDHLETLASRDVTI
jgi:glycosyltransferase involved in cell wall biosynthesis